MSAAASSSSAPPAYPAAAAAAAAVAEEEEEEAFFYEQHGSVCEVCGDGGDLLCCSTCTLVFHRACSLPKLIADPPDDWSCAYCISAGVNGYKYNSKLRQRNIRAMSKMEKIKKANSNLSDTEADAMIQTAEENNEEEEQKDKKTNERKAGRRGKRKSVPRNAASPYTELEQSQPKSSENFYATQNKKCRTSKEEKKKIVRRKQTKRASKDISLLRNRELAGLFDALSPAFEVTEKKNSANEELQIQKEEQQKKDLLEKEQKEKPEREQSEKDRLEKEQKENAEREQSEKDRLEKEKREQEQAKLVKVETEENLLASLIARSPTGTISNPALFNRPTSLTPGPVPTSLTNATTEQICEWLSHRNITRATLEVLVREEIDGTFLFEESLDEVKNALKGEGVKLGQISKIRKAIKDALTEGSLISP